MHDHDIRIKDLLHTPSSTMNLVSHGTFTMGIKIFNHLSNEIKRHNNYKSF